MARASRRRARVVGIGGVFLKAKQPRRLARWYRDHLGLPIEGVVATYRWLSPRRGRKVGNTLWAALPVKNRDWGPAHPTAMVNYRVADLNALLATLRAEGCAVEPRIEESRYGRFGWVVDPEGNRLELWEPPRTYRSPERHAPMG